MATTATDTSLSSSNPKPLNPLAVPFKPTAVVIFAQHRYWVTLNNPFRPLWLPYYIQPKIQQYNINTQPSATPEKPVTLKKIKKWAPRKSHEDDEPVCRFESMLSGKTSLMIRNIPNHLFREDLLRLLDIHCRKENSKEKLVCRSAYDFLYLPMDFGFGANLGYAFVNFTSSAAAVRFCLAYDKYEWEVSVPGQKKKICEITCATIQGKHEMVKHFEQSKFGCHTARYLPVMLCPPRDGFNVTKPVTIGKWVGSGSPPPSNLRKVRLSLRKKALPDTNQ